MRIKSHIPIEFEIDDEQTLVLGAKRLTLDEAARLKAQYAAAQQATKKEAENAEELWTELIRECFKNYIRLDCEVVIELKDGEEKLRKAEDLLDFFGGDTQLLVDTVLAVINQSSLGTQKKIRSLLAIASKRFSPGPGKEAPGPKPETIAASAGDGTSADSGDATSEASGPSGSTDPPATPSSPTSVRSDA